MSKLVYKVAFQKDAYTSSWSLKEVLGIRIWAIVWVIFFRFTPKILNKWRIFLLKLFGADIQSNVFIYPSAKIYVPWLLKMGDKSCLGPYSEVYNLGIVEISSHVTVSQYAYICNGTHDFSNHRQPLMIGHIKIEENVFIGAKAFILPGINIGRYAVIGACSVVTKDVEPYSVMVGNPARHIKKRVMKDD